MFFTKVGVVVAYVALATSIFYFIYGQIVVFDLLDRYGGSLQRGHPAMVAGTKALNQAAPIFAFAIVLGVLVEISRNVVSYSGRK